jgi:hypothetical protein
MTNSEKQDHQYEATLELMTAYTALRELSESQSENELIQMVTARVEKAVLGVIHITKWPEPDFNH